MSKPIDETTIGSLEEQALKRKERLRNLKRRFEDNPTPSEEASKAISNDGPVEGMEIVERRVEEDIVTVMESQLDTLKTPLTIEEIDISNLAPRKPDWDLKRDAAKKLDLLEKKTQRAIAEIIRERLKSTNDGELDLQAAVSVAGYSTQQKESKIVN